MTEWLVQVDDDGRILLPHADPGTTHYRIERYTNDSFNLRPFRVYTDADAERSANAVDESTAALNREMYTDEEWAALQFPCPHCGVAKGVGCLTNPSGFATLRRPLEPAYQNKPYHVRCVHKVRIGLMEGSS